MGIETLYEFATTDMLTMLLVKERAKYLYRNRADKHHSLDKDCDLSDLAPRKMLSRIMPPRYTWVRPRKRKKQANGSNDARKIAEKSLLLTIKRDRDRREKGSAFDYLDQLDAYISSIRQRLMSDDLCFESPHLIPILKDKKKLPDKTYQVTCRPLSVYSRLEDKIILAVTSRYLTKYIDKYLHPDILSYRHARTVNGLQHHVTDFNDGIKMIREYRDAHNLSPIYAADCDIKKFYDIIPHHVVRECFFRIMQQACFSDEATAQVMKVLNAYLDSYNFYTHALLESQRNDGVFFKVRRRFRDSDKKNTYLFKWVDEADSLPVEDKLHIGVSQGGALSLLIANIVLNDVDKVFTSTPDPDRLFVRFCDDIILLHTDYDECCRLIRLYAESLRQHGLYYHDFKSITDCSRKEFWSVKSHLPFRWDDGDDNANRYIGFLGYEMRRDGRTRLRRSNIQRFKEKLQRLKFALRRYRKKHSEEEYLKHKSDMRAKVLRGIDFYKSLDLQLYKHGHQYQYLEKLRDKELR